MPVGQIAAERKTTKQAGADVCLGASFAGDTVVAQGVNGPPCELRGEDHKDEVATELRDVRPAPRCGHSQDVMLSSLGSGRAPGRRFRTRQLYQPIIAPDLCGTAAVNMKGR